MTPEQVHPEQVYYAGRLGRVTSEQFELPGVSGEVAHIAGVWRGDRPTYMSTDAVWGILLTIALCIVLSLLRLPFAGEWILGISMVASAVITRLMRLPALVQTVPGCLTVRFDALSWHAHVKTRTMTVSPMTPPRPLQNLMGMDATLDITLTELTDAEVEEMYAAVSKAMPERDS